MFLETEYIKKTQVRAKKFLINKLFIKINLIGANPVHLTTTGARRQDNQASILELASSKDYNETESIQMDCNPMP